MTRSARDDGWGLVGAGHLDRPSEDKHFPKLKADAIQCVLDGLLTGPALEAGKVALVKAWQRAAHDAAWWSSKATPGESLRTLEELDRAFVKGRYPQAREVLARINELTALHIEVRSEGRVSFGAAGRRTVPFTPIEMQWIRRAVHALVTDPPQELRAPRRGAPPRVFARRLVDELVACLGALGPTGTEALTKKVYARLRDVEGLARLLPPLRDLERLERGRKTPRRAAALPASVRRHTLR